MQEFGQGNKMDHLREAVHHREKCGHGTGVGPLQNQQRYVTKGGVEQGVAKGDQKGVFVRSWTVHSPDMQTRTP